jgi:hypothetical protein
MERQLLEFLKALELAIIPPKNCHHCLMFSQYGSDEVGWNDRLALQVNNAGTFQCFFLEESDFQKPIHQLVSEIALLVESPVFNTQYGVAMGQHLPSVSENG